MSADSEQMSSPIEAAGRKSPVSLYNPHIATLQADADQNLRPGRLHKLHPPQRPTIASCGEGAEETMKGRA